MLEQEPDIRIEFRKLPAVDSLLRDPSIVQLGSEFGRDYVAETLRQLLDCARDEIRSGARAPEAEEWPARLRTALQRAARPSLMPVINATGVIVHTNLGRAPLSVAARAAMSEVAEGYSNLEYRLDEGTRGSRHDHARERLCRLTGAEDAVIVNNNAGAVFLTLAGLCSGSDVLVSRGQLVEIGGGFRIPDVLRQSGATLVEVGTTNRTHVRDYEEAMSERTGALMRIHSSNFRQIGFVAEAPLEALVAVARAYANDGGGPVLVIDDLGSGTLLDTSEFGLAPEPMVQASLGAGADVVTFSGDKLLGGPQAGIILGRTEPIARLRRHPLARALRVDKMTLAAMDATLRSYELGRAVQEIPVWRMIAAPVEQMQKRAEGWMAHLQEQGDRTLEMEVTAGESAVGGGSLPGETLPTYLLAVRMDRVDAAAASLRRADPPIVCRIQQDRLLFDPRTVLPEQDMTMLSMLVQLTAIAGADSRAAV